MTQVYTNPASLPPDFKEFLHDVPAGETFTLWNLQGALRFSRPGVPAAMSFEPELTSGMELSLVWELEEDTLETARRQAESGRDLRYGRRFVKLCTGLSNASPLSGSVQRMMTDWVQ